MPNYPTVSSVGCCVRLGLGHVSVENSPRGETSASVEPSYLRTCHLHSSNTCFSTPLADPHYHPLHLSFTVTPNNRSSNPNKNTREAPQTSQPYVLNVRRNHRSCCALWYVRICSPWQSIDLTLILFPRFRAHGVPSSGQLRRRCHRDNLPRLRSNPESHRVRDCGSKQAVRCYRWLLVLLRSRRYRCRQRLRIVCEAV
jgi:hypothetical protein